MLISTLTDLTRSQKKHTHKIVLRVLEHLEQRNRSESRKNHLCWLSADIGFGQSKNANEMTKLESFRIFPPFIKSNKKQMVKVLENDQ